MRKDRDLSDYLPYLYDTDQHGAINWMSGGKGNGKTHEAVVHARGLTKFHDYAVITNIQFINESGQKSFPENVYFATDLIEFWEAFAEIREEDPYRSILVIIDEFQNVAHRYRSTDPVVLAVDKWLRTFRKNILSSLFITQNIHPTVPKLLLLPTEHIIFKRKNLINEFNSRAEFTPPYYGFQELSFLLDVKGSLYTLRYPDGSSKRKPITQIKDHEFTLDDMGAWLPSFDVKWTVEGAEGVTYSTYGSAHFSRGELYGVDASEWLPDLMAALGRATPVQKPKVIREFFEEYEQLDYVDRSYENASEEAAMVRLRSEAVNDSIPYRQIGEMYGITGEAVRQKADKLRNAEILGVIREEAVA